VTAAVNGTRLLDRLQILARSARTEGGDGVTRLAWSAADLAGRALVREWLGEAGVTPTTDAAGNLIAEWAGTEPGLAPLVTGSHLDTVGDGGALDGAYGAVAGFEIVAALASAGERLRHPIRAVAWANEEGVVAPPFTGSRVAAAATVDTSATGPDGSTLAERLRATGGDPDGLATAAWPAMAAYLELHIEQGPVLDATGTTIGVVTGITGIRQGTITVTGTANHAGTTPMHQRGDALVAAAPLVSFVQRLATDGPADVATVGSLTIRPGNANVVPGQVTLSYDIRSLEDERNDQAVALLRAELSGIAAATGTEIALSPTSFSAAVPTHPLLRDVVAAAATGLGLATTELASGAGHDAGHIAALGPMGMIFVPSIGGLSHNPAEATSAADLVAGAETLLAALRLADLRIDP
jgi:beta-ureidopropionase / N-carbamoyl-L-amino-acid hydrolase